jgi:glycerol-3-phosphate dehydrogenase
VPECPYVVAEAVYAVQHELAFTLADVLVRRVPLAFETRDHGISAAHRVAARLAPLLGWDERAVSCALAAYERDVARLFTVE